MSINTTWSDWCDIVGILNKVHGVRLARGEERDILVFFVHTTMDHLQRASEAEVELIAKHRADLLRMYRELDNE